MKIELQYIQSSPNPIRSSWDEEKLNELAQSLKEQGLIQPIKVRSCENGYEIVYGHRRVEAARRAGFTEIEATVEEVDDQQTLIQALIENVQREDMTPLDTARALKALKDVTGWSAHEIERQGILDNSRVVRFLALLNQSEEVQTLLDPLRGAAGISPKHVEEANPVKDNPKLMTAVLQKAATEQLSAAQTRRVAESVAAAPSEHAKQVLIHNPYSEVIHDPAFIKERAEEFGAHDPLYKTPKSTVNQNWQTTPEVSHIISLIKQWTDSLTSFRKADEIGKLAPEAKSFIARRIRQLSEALNEWAIELEENSNV